MQYIPQNAHDLAKEYMQRSEAEAEHNRIVVPIVEGNIRKMFRNIYGFLYGMLKHQPVIAPIEPPVPVSHERQRAHTQS